MMFNFFRRILYIFVMVSVLTPCYAQTKYSFKPDRSMNDVVEIDTTKQRSSEFAMLDDTDNYVYFPGSNGATSENNLLKYLKKHLVYPDSAYKAKVEGNLIVRFEINSSGKVLNPVILKGSLSLIHI